MIEAWRYRTRPSGIQTNARGFRAGALLWSYIRTFSLFIPFRRVTVDSDDKNMFRRQNIEAKKAEGELNVGVEWGKSEQGTRRVAFFSLCLFFALLDWRDFSWRLVEKLSFFFLRGLLTDSIVFLKEWSAKMLHCSNNTITADVNKSCTSRVAGAC